MKMHQIALLSLVLFAVGVSELHAGTELTFWHYYIHSPSGVPHYSFHLASYKRGLFFGTCAWSTRSQRWSFSFDLSGDGLTYTPDRVTLRNDDELRTYMIMDGTVTVDPRHETAVIALQVVEDGVSTPFVGNGTFRIHVLKNPIGQKPGPGTR
jgi:hypothetical protein